MAGKYFGDLGDVLVGQQVGGEALLVGLLDVEQPADVGVEQALGQAAEGLAVAPGAVRVALLVAEGVMAAVIGDPAGDRPLDREAAGDGERDAQRAVGLERAVREVAVEADRDAVAADGVEHDGECHVDPGEAGAPEHEAGAEDGEQGDHDEDGEGDLLPAGLELGCGDLLQRAALIAVVLDGGDRGVQRLGHLAPRRLVIYASVTYASVTSSPSTG